MRIQLQTVVLTSGERFPVLLNESGVPLQFPLAFSIHDRHKGGVTRLKARLRRIRDLHLALYHIGVDLDRAILYREIDIYTVESALYWLEDEHESGEYGSSPTTRNQRISVWADFLSWAIETGHWTGRTKPVRGREERDTAARLRILLEEHRLPITAHREVNPLTSREVNVLDELLGPGPGELFQNSPFSGRAAERTWVLYQLLRWGGLRLGEALKLRPEDIPPEESQADAILREIEGRALKLRVERRVDDLSDRRRNEPAVKRHGRLVPVPDHLVQQVWRYHALLPSSATYLIRTADGSRELSYSQASKLVYEIRPAATELFERLYPGDPHTLCSFHWHRLRHTRAIELLPEYFPDNKANPIRQQLFCDAFGWAKLESAEPYLRWMYRRTAEALWRNSLERLDS
jgi:integrase